MDTPRQFFDAFVKPSYEAWLKKPPALLLASCAVHQANVMVERLVRYESRSETLATRQFDAKVRKRRAEIAKAHPDFALVVDIDDAHKHLELRDRDRAVTSSKQTAIRHIGGSWAGSWGGSWGSSWGSKREIVVQLDNDTQQRPLAEILKNVVEMWNSLLPQRRRRTSVATGAGKA